MSDEKKAAAPVEERASERGAQRGVSPVLITFLAFVSALIVGAVIIIFASPDAMAAWGRFFSAPGRAFIVSFSVIGNAYGSLFAGAIGNPTDLAAAFRSGKAQDFALAFSPLSETIVSTTPLIMSGLGITLAFRAGLFNIGGQGQVILGAAGATLAGFAFPGLPAFVHLPLALLDRAPSSAPPGASSQAYCGPRRGPPRSSPR